MANGNAPRRWLSLKEAADEIEIHVNTMYKRARKAVKKYASKQTGMPVVRHGGKGPFKFPCEEFKKWANHPTE